MPTHHFDTNALLRATASENPTAADYEAVAQHLMHPALWRALAAAGYSRRKIGHFKRKAHAMAQTLRRGARTLPPR